MERRLDAAERLAGVGSWQYDIDAQALVMSAGTKRILDLPDDGTLDLDSFLALTHPDDRERLRHEFTAVVLTGTPCDLEYRVVRVDGSTRTLQTRGEVVRDHPDGPLLFRGVTLDVTAQRDAEDARRQSDLLFRKGFDEAVTGLAIQRPGDGRYMRVNDALCTLLGRTREELLTLSFNDVTHPDDLAGNGQLLSMAAAGEGFRDLEKRYLRPDGSSVWASVHVTTVEDASGAVTALFAQVIDIGEHKARERELESMVAEADALVRIRDALAEARMVLFAQPIVDVLSGETVQHELLIRMRERDGTIVAPGDFLPAAERYGLIGEIDTWVIGQAAALAAGGTAVEINLSGQSIGDPAILVAIERALEESGADPSRLVFEITETAIMKDFDAGRAFAERLTALGCGFALDDFGTGFGGLTYLKHLPANTLKIDIEFVRDLVTNDADQRLVRAIVDLAGGFGLTTVAEGVEDEQTLQRLRELGVDRAQGYFLGRPGALLDEDPEVWVPATDAAGGGSPGDLIEQVRGMLDIFASRDVDRAIERLAPDVEIWLFGTPERTGKREPYRGHAGVREYFADIARVWRSLDIEPTAFRRVEDTVIVFGRVHARSSAGDDFYASALWVWKFGDGQVTSVQTFRTPPGA